MSSFLLGEPPTGRDSQLPPDLTSRAAPLTPPSDGAGQHPNSTMTVFAGVGVLLLAMGVGVLIGRSGSPSSPKQSAAPAQVISVSSTPAAGTSTAAGESSFTGDWPSGTTGYTVQLQTLPRSGSSVSAVEAAKTAASAKGAKGVGALRSEEFASLTAGNYVIYSGVYPKKAEAVKALAGLQKRFPGASAIHVSSGSSGSSSGSSEPSRSSSGSGVGSSESHPAPPSVLESLKTSKGKSYEEKSKNLPNVISTG